MSTDQHDPGEEPNRGVDPSTPSSEVLLVQLNSNELKHEDPSLIKVEPPFEKFLCYLKGKGVTRKLYISTTLEGELEHEALLDTGAEITLMSSKLFKTLQATACHSCRDIKLLPCSISIQPYVLESATVTHLV